MTKFIAYYRVSTKEQGQSGLGLAAQQQAVKNHLRDDHILLAEFTEVESGKRNDRPQLTAAIEQAQHTGATLLIAKLDRLSRNASFIFALRDSGVKFVAADMPEANDLTVGIMAVVADNERKAISRRTTEALAQKKAQGVTLGTPANLTPEAILAGRRIRQQNAHDNENNRRAGLLAVSLHQQDHGYREIARQLNQHGFRPRRGKQFHHEQVKRLIKRYS